MSEEISYNRRRFLRNAAMTFATAGLSMIWSADAQSNSAKPAGATTWNFRLCVAFLVLLSIALPLAAHAFSTESSINSRTVVVEGLKLHYLTADRGLAVILLPRRPSYQRTTFVLPFFEQDNHKSGRRWVMKTCFA